MNIENWKNYLNKIFVFYFPGKAGYWNSITPCCITEKPQQLGRYYLDFSSKADYPDNFSAAGIPQYSFRGQPYIEHPIPIAQYALGLYELLNRKNFLRLHYGLQITRLMSKMGLVGTFIMNILNMV